MSWITLSRVTGIMMKMITITPGTSPGIFSE